MARVLSDFFGDRLVDYFLVVGCHCNAMPSSSNSLIQNPKLLKRYPTKNHADFPLPDDIVFFCQPDGCLCSATPPEDDRNLARTFFFTLTDKETNKRRHGVCLNFFRTSRMRNGDDDDDDDSVCSLTSLCLVTHHSFFVPFAEAVETFRHLVENIACASNHFQDGPDRKGILHEWDDFLAPSSAHSLKAQELEAWIRRFLETPLPSPGHVRLELEMAVKPAITLAYPDESRLFLVDFPAYLILELLGVEQVLQVLTAVIMEQKVALTSVDYQTVSTCVMALLVYMYPLEYVYPVIPLLPTSMPLAETILQTPAPFLIGVPASFFHPRRGVERPNDVTVVDLDSGEITFATDAPPLPSLPKHALSTLKESLNKALVSLQSSGTTRPSSSGSERIRRLSSHGRISPSYQDPVALDISIRVSFIQFFLSPQVLGELRYFLRTLRLYQRPVIAQQKVFFFKRIQSILSDPSDREFATQLASTQGVDCFGEWYQLYAPNSAISRILNDGIVEPYHIGDKPKYFAGSLNPLPISLYEPSSSLGQAMLELKANDSSQFLDEYSTSYSSSTSSMSSVSTLYEGGGTSGYRVYSFPNILSDDNDEEVKEILAEEEEEGSPIVTLDSRDPSDDQSDDEKTFLSPRARKNAVSTLKRDDTTIIETENDIPIVTNVKILPRRRESDPRNHPRIILSGDQEEERPRLLHSLSHPIQTPGVGNSKSFPSVFRSPSTSPHSFSPNKYVMRAMRPSTSQIIEKKWQSAYDVESISTRPLKISSSSGFNAKSPFTLKSPIRADSPTPALESEEQREAKHVVSEAIMNALKGVSIGFFAERKLSKILVDEKLRLVVITRIFEAAKDPQGSPIKDVWVSKSVFRAIVALLRCCVVGLDVGMDSGSLHTISSAFSLLEIAYTFFTCSESVLASPSPKKIIPTRSFDSQSSIISDATSSGSVSPSDLADKSQTLPRFLSSRRLSNPKIILDPPLFPAERMRQKLSQDLDALLDRDQLGGRNRVIRPQTSFNHEKRRFSYVYKELVGKGRAKLWDKSFFWDAVFLDAVAAERTATGLDERPSQLIERFSSASIADRRRMEEEEDAILCSVLHNLIAFMLAFKVNRDEIRRKANRLVGQAHLGLAHTDVIYKLLDSFKETEGNSVELLPLASRKESNQKEFLVHIGSSLSSPSAILAIRDSCMSVKTMKGILVDRYWYENVIKVNFHPKSDLLIMWHRKLDNDTIQTKFSTNNCRELYNCVRDKLRVSVPAQLPSVAHSKQEGIATEYLVRDLNSGESGVLSVSSQGIECRFVESTLFIDLRTIRDCGSQKDVFEVKEDDGDGLVTHHRFASSQCSEICQDVLSVFSFASAQLSTSLSLEDDD